MSQNWIKRIKVEGCTKYWLIDKHFVKTFKLCQSLAYVPVADVCSGFDQIKIQSNINFEPIIIYIESNYIGNNNKPARFPIETWNLYERVIAGQPTSNNPVESWHSALFISDFN